MLKQVSEITFFVSQIFSASGEKIIESCLMYLLRNLQYCDPNDFFKFGKLMWIFFLHVLSSKLPTDNCHTMSGQANKQIMKDD